MTPDAYSPKPNPSSIELPKTAAGVIERCAVIAGQIGISQPDFTNRARQITARTAAIRCHYWRCNRSYPYRCATLTQPTSPCFVVEEFKTGSEAVASLLMTRPPLAEFGEGGDERQARRSNLPRCILPVDGFFEWKAIKGQRAKQPYAIGLKDGSPFGLGGLWENWKDPATGEWIRTFAIITTDANEMRDI